MPAARRQLDIILFESAQQFGPGAAKRYAQLLTNAMEAVGVEPDRLGASDVPGRYGIRSFPAHLVRMAVDPADRVKSPRHLVLYRVAQDGVTEILGFAHDRMILPRAARRAMRAADD
jgi:toxin ParE1/3/4